MVALAREMVVQQAAAVQVTKKVEGLCASENMCQGGVQDGCQGVIVSDVSS